MTDKKEKDEKPEVKEEKPEVKEEKAKASEEKIDKAKKVHNKVEGLNEHGIDEISGDVAQFLTFRVDENEYGVDIMKVREIRGWTSTTKIPNSPEFMRGVINLRGLVVPIFDLRTRFDQGVTEADEINVVIVIAIGERTIGVLVDAVSDILTVGTDDIKPAPSRSETGIQDEYVSGLISIEDGMVILLDVDYLFDTNTLEAAAEVAAA